MLSILIWFPVLCGLILACLPQTLTTVKVRSIALYLSGVLPLLMIWILTQFHLGDPGLQFREY